MGEKQAFLARSTCLNHTDGAFAALYLEPNPDQSTINKGIGE